MFVLIRQMRSELQKINAPICRAVNTQHTHTHTLSLSFFLSAGRRGRCLSLSLALPSFRRVQVCSCRPAPRPPPPCLSQEGRGLGVFRVVPVVGSSGSGWLLQNCKSPDSLNFTLHPGLVSTPSMAKSLVPATTMPPLLNPTAGSFPPSDNNGTTLSTGLSVRFYYQRAAIAGASTYFRSNTGTNTSADHEDRWISPFSKKYSGVLLGCSAESISLALLLACLLAWGVRVETLWPEGLPPHGALQFV